LTLKKKYNYEIIKNKHSLLSVKFFYNIYIYRDVQYSASGQKILDIMCGDQPDGCTPKRWVDFLGNNPQSPFIFLMNITDTPYNTTKLNTNQTITITAVNTTQNLCSNPVNLPFYKAASCGCSVSSSFFNFILKKISILNNICFLGLSRILSGAGASAS